VSSTPGDGRSGYSRNVNWRFSAESFGVLAIDEPSLSLSAIPLAPVREEALQYLVDVLELPELLDG
jgi:hypothetical protein